MFLLLFLLLHTYKIPHQGLLGCGTCSRMWKADDVFQEGLIEGGSNCLLVLQRWLQLHTLNPAKGI